MKVAIMGAGALGCSFGGILAEHGVNVALIDVVPELVDVINERGLHLEGIGGDRVVRVRATTRPEEVGKADLVLFLVKSHHTEAAAKAARPLVGPDTIVLTLQNGLGHVPKITRVLGEERVLQGVTYGAATVLGLAHVAQTYAIRNDIGELDGSMTDRASRVAADLSRAGLETVATDRIQACIWRKLIGDVAMNALCAVSGLLDAELGQVPEGVKFVEELTRETATVAVASGVDLSYEDALATVRSWFNPPIPGKPSTMQDMERRRNTEIDALNGAIVAEGERLGIPTPYNAAITYMVKMIEATWRLHA